MESYIIVTLLIVNALEIPPCGRMVQDFHLVLRLHNIPFYVYATFSLSVHLLMEISVTSISWLLWMKLW